MSVDRLADCAQFGQSAEVTQVVGEGKYLTTGEAADLIGCSQSYVIKMVDSGELEGRPLPGSKHRRIPREAAERKRDELAGRRTDS